MTLLSALRRNRSGVAMTEFALGAPLVLMAGLWGTETANFALTNMKVGQLAVHIADNSSRVGDLSTLQNRRVYEYDINDVLYGAQVQAGGMQLFRHGRVIISSLQVDSNGRQYIHWQRCRGVKPVGSSYGDEGQILPNGMGPTGAEVIAQADDAVIFVEVRYTYQPIVSQRFVTNPEISSIASFTVRDDRDISQLYQRDPGSPDPVQRCNAYSGPISISSSGEMN
ncbi:MAG: hypothetical protein O9272_10870 [Brevundimonas sp.]|jgi:hypothetical protein|nr:hypothetical protein [Brevundimonas sp.]